MFDFGMGQLLLLGAIALIAVGPKQLPEVAKTLGRFIGELKKYTGDITSQVIQAREATNRALLLQNNEAVIQANLQAQNTTVATTAGGSEALVHPPGFGANLRAASVGDDHSRQMSFAFTDFMDGSPISPSVSSTTSMAGSESTSGSGTEPVSQSILPPSSSHHEPS